MDDIGRKILMYIIEANFNETGIIMDYDFGNQNYHQSRGRLERIEPLTYYFYEKDLIFDRLFMTQKGWQAQMSASYEHSTIPAFLFRALDTAVDKHIGIDKLIEGVYYEGGTY